MYRGEKINMETKNNINNLKISLAICKERLDATYQSNNYFAITEEAEKFLNYLIQFLI